VEDKGRLPIAEVREEFGDACRVQVNIFGSNTSSYITWLKAGTTALVIRYLELAAKTSTVETSPCSGESQKLEGDLSAFASQETNNIDLRAHLIVEQQWHSLCHALFHQKLGLEWDEILKEWGRNINYTASEYDDHVSRRVEWRSIRGSADVPERHEGHYAAVNILRREYGCERSPILKHHAISPPSNTRAYLRGHAIRYWMEINKERIPPIHTPIDIHWGQLGVEGKDGTATFPTPNPFDSYKMRLPDVYDALRRALRDKINFFDELSST
jgi:hypothetical protein